MEVHSASPNVGNLREGYGTCRSRKQLGLGGESTSDLRGKALGRNVESSPSFHEAEF